MKIPYLKLLLFLIVCTPSLSQNQNNSEEKFDYEFKGYIKLKKFNGNPTSNDTIWVAEKYRYNVIAEDNAKNDKDEFEYVVLKLVNFSKGYEYLTTKLGETKVLELVTQIELEAKNKVINLNKEKKRLIEEFSMPNKAIVEEINIYNQKVDLIKERYNSKILEIEKQALIDKDSIIKNSKNKITGIKTYVKKNWYSKDSVPKTYLYRKNYVDIDDQDKMFWIKKDKFESYLNQGYIQKRYETPVQFAYGASLSIPFKIRPETNKQNIKITPEISLGGYFGLRKRLNRYKPIYLYLPVITAGVTTIGINSNNIIDESTTTPVEGTNDGLVFARTFSVGTFIEFNSFQMGFVAGWDRPGGEIAKNWIYNDRLWYSFSIGYNFLRRNDNK